MHPLVTLTIGIFTVIFMIAALRTNAFIALITAAIIVSLLAPGEVAEKIGRVAIAFGQTAGGIGIVIALAVVIGKCMMDSGAADRIVRGFLSLLGEKRSPWALMCSGFVLSVPVFFDTVFYLLVPLARSLHRRTGKHFLKYCMAIAAGGVITHSLVPPTPGPLIMADRLGIDLGVMILAGAAIALPTTLVGMAFATWIDRRLSIQMRPLTGGMEEPKPLEDRQLPGLCASLLPIVLPVILVSANTVTKTMADAERGKLLDSGQVLQWSALCGQLAGVGTDAETGPAQYVHERLSAAARRSLVSVSDSGVVDADIDATVKEAVSRLADEEMLLLDPAFLGVKLSDDAQRLLDDAVRQLSPEQAARFNRHFRQRAVDGMITAGRGRDALAQVLSQVSLEQRKRLNWLLLEQAFSGQLRQTPWVRAAGVTALVGNPNFALFLSALVAMLTLVRTRKLSLRDLGRTTEVALMSGGMIILITAAGGAFGAMLKAAQIGPAIEGLFRGDAAQPTSGVMFLIVGALVACVIKIAQGSGTVGMITASAMVAAMVPAMDNLGFPPVLLATAIGGGSMMGSWMNDSGFWIFVKMTGLTEGEGLRCWTPLLALVGLSSVVVSLILAIVFSAL